MLVGAHNRTARAELETGAPAVITTDATSPAALAAAVDGLEEAHREVATPVVVVRPRDPGAVPTLLARPAELSSIGYAVPTVGLEELTPAVAPSIQLEDGEITGTLTWELDEFRTGDEPVGTGPAVVDRHPGWRPLHRPDARPDRDHRVDPGRGLPRPRPRPGRPVRGGHLGGQCTRAVPGGLPPRGVVGPGNRPVGGDASRVAPCSPTSPSTVARSSSAARTGGSRRRATAGEGTQQLSGSGNELVIDFDTTGRRVFSPVADVPTPMPVILAGAPPADATEDGFTLIGLGGPAGGVRGGRDAPRPSRRSTGRGALADLDAQLKVGGAAPPGSELEVWLGTQDAEVLAAVERSLAAAGIPVSPATTAEQAQARYDASATGWGLLLGVFTGLMALLVAALVVGLVAVTSWRGVARDLAGLVVAGTPRAVLRSAVRREQLVTVVAGVLLGTACGVVGSVLALPLVPLFDRPAAVPAADLTPVWGVIATTAVGALVIIGGVALAAARGIMARAVPDRLRESL